MRTKILCILQARTGSTRLPGKVLKRVAGKPLLVHEIERIARSQLIDKLVVATTNHARDNAIVRICQRVKVDVFRGSEQNVLDRYYQCSNHYPTYNTIVRITGDCPLIDPQLVDQVITYFKNGSFDYVSNVGVLTYPDGMDVEVFKRKLLNEAHARAKSTADKEHVTPFIRRNKRYVKGNIASPVDWSHIRLTVDTQRDLPAISFLIKQCKPDNGYLDYISILTKYPKYLQYCSILVSR